MNPFGTKHTFELLDRMLDDAMNGTFRESDYNETELSRLETKWMRFLSASALSRENLEQERRSIQGLVSDISHQVKTPIANLRLYEDILEERLEGDDRELIRHLIRETELLEFLIHSLVKISRLETGTIQLSPEDQTILPLLRDALDRAETKSAEKNVTLMPTDVTRRSGHVLTGNGPRKPSIISSTMRSNILLPGAASRSVLKNTPCLSASVSWITARVSQRMRFPICSTVSTAAPASTKRKASGSGSTSPGRSYGKRADISKSTRSLTSLLRNRGQAQNFPSS